MSTKISHNMLKNEVLNLVRPLFQDKLDVEVLRQEIELLNELIKIMKLNSVQDDSLECNCLVDYETIEVEAKINLCLNCGKPLSIK